MGDVSRSSFSSARISIEFNRAKQEEQDRASFSREDEKKLPDYHALPLEDLSSRFTVPDASEGLTDEEVAAARKTFGKNIVAPPSKNPIWMWLGFFFGGFNGFLWFAGALSWLAFGLCYLVRLTWPQSADGGFWSFNVCPFPRFITDLFAAFFCISHFYSLPKLIRLVISPWPSSSWWSFSSTLAFLSSRTTAATRSWARSLL